MERIQHIIDRLVPDNLEQGDYIDDEGYLCCGKCHTRKQCEVEFLGQMQKVPIMCRCREEAWTASQRAEEQRKAQKNVEELQRQGMADKQYLEWTIDKDDGKNPKVSNIVRKYIERWPEMKDSNTGLLFFGDVGTGKTFYAACIANALVSQGVPVLITSLPTLISAMNNGGFETGKDTVLKQLMKKPLVIIDDLGIERNTEYSFEKIYEVIDTRYKSGLPLIVTTNLTKRELEQPDDIRNKRIFDRVLEMCAPVMVAGESRRTVKATQKRKAARELLGI